MRRSAAVAASAVLAGGILVFNPAPAKAEPNADEAQFVALLNAARAKVGLKPLLTDGQLINVARIWSSKMAGDGALSHNPALSSQITNWRSIGENVGTGSAVATIEAAFEASPHHYENMVDPNYDYVGIGVVEVGPTIWVTEDFKQSKSGLPATAAPAPAPAPKPSAKPAPARPTPSPSAAPTRQRTPSAAGGRNPNAAVPPAAVAAAQVTDPTGDAAAATPTPDPSRLSGPESANSSGRSGFPAALAGAAGPDLIDGQRMASLALFGVLGAIGFLASKGKLHLPANKR